MKIGYARVSTKDQSLNLQVDALKKEGCEKIFQETVSGAKFERVKLNLLLEHLREGDVLVVWKLDRLGRSLKHLIALIDNLTKRGIGLKSLNDLIDTTSSQGRLILNIFASLAEFERELLIERTQAGLKAARARGRLGGRKKGLSQEAKEKAALAEVLYKQGERSISEIAKGLKITRATLYNYLRYKNVPIGVYKKKS